MQYARSRIDEDCKEKAFREYIADGIRMVTQNTAKFAGGPYLTVRYDEIIHPKPKDTRTGEEIVTDIVQRAGLKIV